MKKKLNLNKISVASFTTSLNEEKRQTLHGGDKIPDIRSRAICTGPLTANPAVCTWISELYSACCPPTEFECTTGSIVICQPTR